MRQADRILRAFADLDIEIIPQAWGELLPLARRYERSAYAAAYLALAQRLGEPLVTADLRLYNALHPHLAWVVWIEDYPLETQP